MQHIVYDDTADKYPIAILVKDAAFKGGEIDKAYIEPLERLGLDRNDIIVVALTYESPKKVSVKFIKEYLKTLMPALDSVGVKHIFCADSNYFKVIANKRKADVNLGYKLPCAVDDYSHMEVNLGINYKALIHNPLNAEKLDLSLDSFADSVLGKYTTPGTGIIKTAYYPTAPKDIQHALIDLHRYPVLSADIEAFSLKAYEAGVATITFCWNHHEGLAFPCDYAPLATPIDGMYGFFSPNPEIREMLKHFLESYDGTLRWHNATYDLKVLIATLWMEHDQDFNGMIKGLEILTKAFDDTKIIAYLATNTTAGNELGLKDLAHSFAGNYAEEDIKDIRRIPLPKLLEYNLVDGLATNFVFDKHYPVMVMDQQLDLYQSLMKPSLKTIIQMELVGMPMKPEAIPEVKKKLEDIVQTQQNILDSSPMIDKFNLRVRKDAMKEANAKLKVKQHTLAHFADVTFNPNSGLQLQKLLYEEMGLPVIAKTKSGAASTKAEVIESLANHTSDPDYLAVLNALIVRGKAVKILNTFIPAFEAGRIKADGMRWLHGCFTLGGTVSGRLSSKEPNMQNVPSGSTYGKLIKGLFQAPPGWLFCGADFASLEDRINALLTKDPNKLKVYTDGYDGHSLRAFAYFGDQMPEIEDTVESINSIPDKHKQLRDKSKGPTFALTYQGTWSTLVRKNGFPEDKAKQTEERYHSLYAVSTQWAKDRIDEAAKSGYATAAFGLRIRTPLLEKTFLGKSSTPYEAEAEGRTLGNAISGQSYGLLNNRAANAVMERVWNSKYRFDILPVAMIHDAIYFITKDNIAVVEWLNNILIEEMSWQELPELNHEKVKLGAELDIFWPSWAETLTLPNNSTQSEILKLSKDHHKKVLEK